MKALVVIVLGGTYYLLAGLSVLASLYLASHLFMLVGIEAKWLVKWLSA